MKTLHHRNFQEIWNTVPPNYYQKGVKNNFLQRQWHTRKLNIVLSLMDTRYTNVLDVGCASGWFLSQIAAKYPKSKYTGVDVYKKAIEYGKRRYKSLRLLHADAHRLPFRDESFNLVVCTEVLEHVVNPQKVLQEIKRVLMPHGVAIIEMDTGNILFRLIWYWWAHLKQGVWKEAHIHAFNTKKLENMIRKNGFHIAHKKIFNVTMAVAFQLEKRG